MRRTLLIVAAILAVGACGGRGATLSEYAAEAEVLVDRLQDRLAALDQRWEAQTPTLAGASAYWDDRLAARAEFTAGLRRLEPPGDFAALHASYVELFGRLAGAEQQVAVRVAASDAVTEHWAWWDTPEGRAARAVDAECIAACYEAQEFLDSTRHRASLADSPWVPREMREVVRVTFACPDW